MEASIVDLRYKMNDVLRAIERNEDVKILYHGKIKGIIKPHTEKGSKHVLDTSLFNMLQDSETVDEKIERLRRGRHRDL